MVSSPGRLPSWLDFLSSPEPAALSLLSQLLVVEFLIDVLKLASLNTPDTLSNSFSMAGGLDPWVILPCRRMAGAGSTGVYGIRLRGGLRPAQL